MNEETGGDLSAGNVNKGKWSEFSNFKTPRDSLNQSLGTVRRVARAIGLVSQDSDWKPGDILPLATEVECLLYAGGIGDNRQAMLTLDEFLICAPTVWNLDEAQMSELKDKVLPEAQARVAEKIAKEKEFFETKDEETNLFLLQTWDVPRFEALLILLPSIFDKVDNLQAMTLRFKNMESKKVTNILQKRDEALRVEDKGERRKKLQELAEQASSIIAQITHLTPAEIREIATIEQIRGYLFLDTLVNVIPDLDKTIIIAKQVSQAVANTGFSHLEGEYAEKSIHRQDVIGDKLLYGAPTNCSSQDLITKLMRKAKHGSAGKQSPK